MGLPSGTFSESYTQDFAIIRTRAQWLAIAFGHMIIFAILLMIENA